jgi:hypothetical protein
MKHIVFLLLFFTMLFSNKAHAQLEKVIVETYYISDKNDATDVTGGQLDSGSVTYRVYIDMLPGYKLKTIYGNEYHTLKIASTTPFFNNADRGQVFGKDMPMNRLNDNTSALDSWITIGQVTTTNGGKTYFGIPKVDDTNGTIIAGTKNDGGSASIAEGLLANQNPAAGIPLTIQDGMDTMSTIPSDWTPLIASALDSTIFDTINKTVKKIISNKATIQNSGVMGVIPEKNQVLVAQLTTKGELSFELNIELLDPTGKSFYYVANDSLDSLELTITPNKKIQLSRFLKYPFTLVCGCGDLNYLEYDKKRDCDSQDSCKTPIVFGCMDTLACNFDPKATYNVSSLCCYPGRCNNRDISLVCPQLSNATGFILYPNPTTEFINLQITTGSSDAISYTIVDSYGITILEKKLGVILGTMTEQINLANLNKGLYLIRVAIGNSYESKLFMKN